MCDTKWSRLASAKKERTRKLASTSEACVLDVPFSKTFISLWPRLWRRKTIFVYVHILRHFAKTFLVDRKRIRELCTRTCSKQNANQSTQRSERGMKMVTDAIVVFFYFSRQPSKSSSTGQKPKNVESLKSSRIRTIESVARQIRFWNLKKRIDFSVHQLHYFHAVTFLLIHSLENESYFEEYANTTLWVHGLSRSRHINILILLTYTWWSRAAEPSKWNECNPRKFIKKTF